MKLLKTLGLAAVISAAMMAPAGAASATVLTSPAGTEYTGTLTFTGTFSQLIEASVFNVTCIQSTLSGSLSRNTTWAEGSISTITLSGCDSTVDTRFNGSFEVKSGGEVRLVASEITFEKVGVSCVFGSLGAPFKLGTLKGGTTASLSVNAKMPRRIGSSFLCPEFAQWTGSFTVTTPDTLLVD